jgi:hypothetical protein
VREDRELERVSAREHIRECIDPMGTPEDLRMQRQRDRAVLYCGELELTAPRLPETVAARGGSEERCVVKAPVHGQFDDRASAGGQDVRSVITHEA